MARCASLSNFASFTHCDGGDKDEEKSLCNASHNGVHGGYGANPVIKTQEKSLVCSEHTGEKRLNWITQHAAVINMALLVH